jgi:hypothetical protein
MTTLKKIISAVTIIGVLMTTPNIPTENSGNLELPEAIQGVPVSSQVARIGRVVDIVEATSITVEISGSPTLVNASYLFPQYQPLLGDYVYISKQDAQWAVLGTLSGDINSLALNPSFELGDDATTPANWSFTPSSIVAGTPTFRKETGLGVHGNHIGIFRNASAGVAGTSSGTATSTLVPAAEGQKWALGFWVTFATPDVNAALAVQGGNIQITATVQFFDEDGVFISGVDTNFLPIYSAMVNPLFVRTFILADSSSYVVAPVGTASARARIFVSFVMHVNSASEVGIDYVLLRRL